MRAVRRSWHCDDVLEVANFLANVRYYNLVIYSNVFTVAEVNEHSGDAVRREPKP
jgi:hypothetical protein